MQHAFARALLVLGLVLVGCGSDDERSATLPGGGAGPTPQPSGACVEGQVRECRIVVAVREGYSDCVLGSQTCVGTTWTACVTKAMSSGGDAGAEVAADVTPASDAASD